MGLSMFGYAFIQKALVCGILVSVACAILGVFLILRRESMTGHGFSHIAFAGVAVGLALNIMPLAAALAVSVLAALGMSAMKEKAGVHGDTVIGVFSSLGMALGIILAGASRGLGVELMSYLFGDILAIRNEELFLSAGLALAVIAVIVFKYNELLFMTFDRESARVSGIRVRALDSLLVGLTAVTVVLGMKIAGILLVAALIVIPAAAGVQIASSFKKAVLSALGFAAVSVIVGLFGAVKLNLPASGMIVVTAAVCFGVACLVKRVRKG